jgi:hypothetical protein
MMHQKWKKKVLSGLVIGLCMVLLWVRSAYNEASRKANQNRDLQWFAQLEYLLKIYHGNHGAFPPTKYQVKPGGPVHSWRVLLAKHTNSKFISRYDDYDFSQEWNSSNNLAVWADAPRVFRTRGAGLGNSAHYLALGKDEVWPTRWPLKARLVTIGNDRILIIEDPESKIHWLEPNY